MIDLGLEASEISIDLGKPPDLDLWKKSRPLEQISNPVGAPDAIYELNHFHEILKPTSEKMNQVRSGESTKPTSRKTNQVRSGKFTKSTSRKMNQVRSGKSNKPTIRKTNQVRSGKSTKPTSSKHESG